MTFNVVFDTTPVTCKRRINAFINGKLRVSFCKNSLDMLATATFIGLGIRE